MLQRYLRALWWRKWLLLGPVVLLPLVTLVASLRQDALYEARADVLVERQGVAATTLIGQTPVLDDAERTMTTQTRLARVRVVAERTLEATGDAGSPASELLGRSSVHSVADILRFTVADEDPGRAARLASEYARQYVRYRVELDTAGLAATLGELRDQIERLEAAGDSNSPVYARLVDREQQLESLKALRASNVSVVQTPRAGDAEMVAPRPRRNTAVAAAAGLVAGLIFVFLAESLRTRPRSDEEVEALLQAPVLARLLLDEHRVEGPGEDSTDPASDAVHALRAGLELANAGVHARAIMITSPRSGAGKSATALRLAIAMAQVGRHVTLVDLDLRASVLTRLLGLEGRPGIASVVRGEHELTEALAAVTLDGGRQGAEASENGRADVGALLEVVGCGPPEMLPAALLSSTALATVLDELQQRADILLVDVPPVLEAPDSAAVAAQLSGLLLVVNLRRARTPELADVRRVIESWPLAKLGVVLTDGRERGPSVRQLPRARQPSPSPVAESEGVR